MSRPSVADGTRRVDRRGHARIRVDGRWLYERRIVMEGLISRPLERGERVVQVNGRLDDVTPSNLELWSTLRVFPPLGIAPSGPEGVAGFAHSTQTVEVVALVRDAAAHRQTVAKRRARQARAYRRNREAKKVAAIS